MPVKTLTTKVMAKAIFDEHDPNCIRSSKVWKGDGECPEMVQAGQRKENEGSHSSLHNEVLQKMPSESASISSSEPSTSTGQPATPEYACHKQYVLYLTPIMTPIKN